MYIIIKAIGAIHDNIKRHHHEVLKFSMHYFFVLADSSIMGDMQPQLKNDCSSIYQDSDDDSSISDGDDEENETPNDEILRHSQS